MSRKSENTSFTCEHCGRKVMPVTNGSYRNHCPFCLYSKHVDIVPGDRMGECGGLMEPMALGHKSGTGFQIVHECRRCGGRSVNRVAEDTVQPDDIAALATMSAKSYSGSVRR